MKTLVLLRGISCSGKSSFIEVNDLNHYTLSYKNILLQLSSPVMNEYGTLEFNSNLKKKAWKQLFESLEARMSRGEFVIIDDNNFNQKNLKRYYQLKKQFGYKVVMVDFYSNDEPVWVDASLEGMINFTSEEEFIKQVGESKTPNIPNGLIDKYILSSELESYRELIYLLEEDLWVNLDQYKKIHHIGDIHGCRDALFTYLVGGKLKEDEFYIFTGDYTDRGPQNAETVSYLYSLRDEPNVVFLEGNHESKLKRFAKGRKVESENQFDVTKSELVLAEKNGLLDMDQLKEWTQTFKDGFFYRYKGADVYVTHGGLTSMNTSPILVSSEQMINGVGARNFDVDFIFSHKADAHRSALEENLIYKKYVQVHGHRNNFNIPINQYPNSFNLEGQVEFGGHLRVLTIEADPSGALTFNPEYVKSNTEPLRIEDSSRTDFVKNELELSYEIDKPIEINNHKHAKLTDLSESIKYPVIAYQDYDGVMFKVARNGEDIIYEVTSSHSEETIEKAFAIIDRAITSNKEQLNKIANIVLDRKVELSFMLLNNELDSIMKYEKESIVLLEAVHNDGSWKRQKLTDSETEEIARTISFKDNPIHYKSLAFIANDWSRLLGLYRAIKSDKGTLNGKGFVLEDAEGKTYYIETNMYKLLKCLFLKSEEYQLKQHFFDVPYDVLESLKNKFKEFKLSENE